jgi:hypothetical protein
VTLLQLNPVEVSSDVKAEHPAFITRLESPSSPSEAADNEIAQLHPAVSPSLSAAHTGAWMQRLACHAWNCKHIRCAVEEAMYCLRASKGLYMNRRAGTPMSGQQFSGCQLIRGYLIGHQVRTECTQSR